jgi:L,D-peptidoglycan transpeptidase YkuD (ErfK/YbiS/YcfS/YnhG family)
MRHGIRTVLGLAALWAAGCFGGAAAPADPSLSALPVETSQALVVRPANGSPVRVTVAARERRGAGWTAALPAMEGVVGRNGFAAPGAKREGDGKTPAGVYPLGPAFGYDPHVETALEYWQATADDIWVDDPDSPQYNRWVHGPTAARSFERMRRDDDLYRYGAVIRYNTDPIVPGLGSAIFLHVWSGPGKGTAGCMALSREDVVALLRWLDRAKNPVIILDSP